MNNLPNPLRINSLLTVLALLAALTSVTVNASTLASHRSLWCDEATLDEAIHEIGDDLVLRSEEGKPLGASLLALSGGGSRGSWGAGFLAGWQDIEEEQRVFDLVTGVSVGALLSTYSYIGDWKGLAEVMENIRNRDVFRKRFPVLWPLYATSAFNNKPLAKTLVKTIGPEQLRAVAQRIEPGLLCVATVEIATGQLVKWNLTGIAEKFVEAEDDATAETWLALYRKILVAATSVPGAFPPQNIVMPDFATDEPLPFGRESWHIDAGVRTQVFGDFGNSELINLYADFLDLVEEMDSGSLLGPAEIVLIINGPSSVETDWTPPRRGFLPLLKYATRSLNLILNQTALDSRERLIEGIRLRLGEPGEGRWHLRMASMTKDELLDCGALSFKCAGDYFLEGEGRGHALAWDESSDLER